MSSYYSREIDRILCLEAYGQTYLTPEEYARCLAHAWRVYYERLGHQWVTERFRGASPDFWEFHTARLSGIGRTIERKRLAMGACAALLRMIGSPFELARAIVRSRRPVEDPWRA